MCLLPIPPPFVASSDVPFPNGAYICAHSWEQMNGAIRDNVTLYPLCYPSLTHLSLSHSLPSESGGTTHFEVPLDFPGLMPPIGRIPELAVGPGESQQEDANPRQPYLDKVPFAGQQPTPFRPIVSTV